MVISHFLNLQLDHRLHKIYSRCFKNIVKLKEIIFVSAESTQLVPSPRPF